MRRPPVPLRWTKATGSGPWLAAGGALYTVDFETGAATKVGDIAGLDGTLRDIAILPAM